MQNRHTDLRFITKILLSSNGKLDGVIGNKTFYNLFVSLYKACNILCFFFRRKTSSQ
jgi:hypothetical protein